MASIHEYKNINGKVKSYSVSYRYKDHSGKVKQGMNRGFSISITADIYGHPTDDAFRSGASISYNAVWRRN